MKKKSDFSSGILHKKLCSYTTVGVFLARLGLIALNWASLVAHCKSWSQLNDLKWGKITDNAREIQSLLFCVSCQHFPLRSVLRFDDIIMVEKSKLVCWNRGKSITFFDSITILYPGCSHRLNVLFQTNVWTLAAFNFIISLYLYLSFYHFFLILFFFSASVYQRCPLPVPHMDFFFKKKSFVVFSAYIHKTLWIRTSKGKLKWFSPPEQSSLNTY